MLIDARSSPDFACCARAARRGLCLASGHPRSDSHVQSCYRVVVPAVEFRQHYRGDTVTWPVASTLSVCGFGREVK